MSKSYQQDSAKSTPNQQTILLYKGSPLSRHDSIDAAEVEKARLLEMDATRPASLFTIEPLVDLYRRWLKAGRQEALWKELAYACNGEVARKLTAGGCSWQASCREMAIKAHLEDGEAMHHQMETLPIRVSSASSIMFAIF